jgi:uncharacterized membrane protein
VTNIDLEFASTASELIEVAAIAVIVIGVVLAASGALVAAIRNDGGRAFQSFKRHNAWGLLIGLDLLIAADVIKTVTLDPTLENALVLAILVLIRTFLSWALVLEVEGRWPWQAVRRTLQEDQDEA